MKAPQSKLRTRKRQEEGVKQPKHFNQAKGLRHLKQGRGKVSKIHHVSLYQIPNKDLHISAIQHSHFEATPPYLPIPTTYPGPTFS